jgi:hypothetical protein
MNINNCIYIFSLIFSFQYYILARKYDQNDLEIELINLIERKLHSFSIKSNENPKESTYDEYQVDPNDHVDVNLWNKLNDEDIKKMPQIDDYSDEATALRWLKWYSRISLRYHQVYD